MRTALPASITIGDILCAARVGEVARSKFTCSFPRQKLINYGGAAEKVETG